MLKQRSVTRQKQSGEVLVATARGTSVPGIVIDLSEIGMGICIANNESLLVGETVAIEFRGDRIEATVRHITNGDVVHVGLRFAEAM